MFSESEIKDEDLKEQLEQQIKQDEEKEVSLKVAQEILEIKSVDKEYAALQKRALNSLFKYEKSTHKLRPYQTEAMERLAQLLDDDSIDTVGVQLPTGAGKTFLIHAFIAEHFKNKNVLVITPSWEIANQHAATVCRNFKDGNKRVRRLGGSGQLIDAFPEFGWKEKGKVVITTAALFYARQTKIRENMKAHLIVVDEGHYGWKKKRLNGVRMFARENDVDLVLLTATPPKDMQNLPFAAHLRYLDLVPEYLVRCEVMRLDTGESFDPVIRNGILSNKSRIEISTRQTRYEKIVESSLPLLKGQTIYYAGSVKEAMGVAESYKAAGLTSVVVHSKWQSKGDKINALAIEKFRKNEVQVLVNVQMLSMGFDVPNVETIVVARPVESDTLFTQMVGRGARPAEGKDKFILIDVHDTIAKPEVAKIFEHDHMFYAGVEDLEEEQLEQLQEDAHIIHLPLQPRAVDVEFDYQRSRVVVPYFLSPYQAA